MNLFLRLLPWKGTSNEKKVKIISNIISLQIYLSQYYCKYHSVFVKMESESFCALRSENIVCMLICSNWICFILPTRNCSQLHKSKRLDIALVKFSCLAR